MITETNSRKVAVIAEQKKKPMQFCQIFITTEILMNLTMMITMDGIQKLMMKLLIAQNLMTLRFMMKMEMNMKKTIFQKKISTLRRYSEL